jgi:hypothetical protein
MADTLTESLNTLYTTTWYLRKDKVVDQIFNSTPFWYSMSKKGKRTTQSGGRKIEIPLRYAKNETVKSIGRGSTVDLEDTDPLTVCQYDWKYTTGHILRYFADFQMNRGKAQLMNKVNSDIDTLQSSYIDKMETDLFGNGTGDDNKAIDGLGKLISITPTTGTVAGIDRSTHAWWRNNATSMASKAASIYLRKYMQTMFNTCGLQGEGVTRFPDLIVTDQTSYELYEDECLEISKIVIGDKKMADLGFGELAFKGRPITWSPACTSGYMYFLNTSVLEYVSDPVEDFNLGDWLPIVNQPRDVVAHAMAVGNLTTSNMKRLGVLYSIAA